MTACRTIRRIGGAGLTLALAASCRGTPPRAVNLDGPAPSGSSAADIHAHEDGLYLSWIESLPEAPARLRFAVRRDGAWTAPRTVIEDDLLLVNWADVPSVVPLGNGSLAAHWLERWRREGFAYGVRLALSPDGGGSWSPPLSPHPPDPDGESGFVTLLPRRDGGLSVFWLDGRAIGADGVGTMQLRQRIWNGTTWSEERLLDDDVCNCCQTAAVEVPAGDLVVYRDHTGPTRDLAALIVDDAGRVERSSLPLDGWRIAGCPVNGPAAVADGKSVAVAWYTEAEARPRVLLSLSRDGGATFGTPRRVDDGRPLGRVDLTSAAGGTVVVSWLEREVAGAARVQVRGFDGEGRESGSISMGRASAGRSSGFPRVASAGRTVYAVWVEPGPPPRLELREVSLDGRDPATSSARDSASAARLGSRARTNAPHAATP